MATPPKSQVEVRIGDDGRAGEVTDGVGYGGVEKVDGGDHTPAC